MADRSKIEWTDATWNPVTGCTAISEGCDNCYARRMATRFQGDFKVKLHPERLDIPLKWRKPRRIFVCSMSDLFHDEVGFSDILTVYATINKAKHHTFMVLTKRPQRMFEFYRIYGIGTANAYPQNLWLGVTAENQARADERIPILLQIPAAVRFVSIEPMLGPVVLQAPYTITGDGRDYLSSPGKRCLHWIIVGGETGPDARPIYPDWVRSVRDQCQMAQVPLFFKQWGEWISEQREGVEVDLQQLNSNQMVGAGKPGRHTLFTRVGKKRAGRELDGKVWDEFPGVR